MMRDPRDTAWERRRQEQEHLAMNRLRLATVCGCDRCGDGADLVRIMGEIRVSENAIAKLTDQITDALSHAY